MPLRIFCSIAVMLLIMAGAAPSHAARKLVAAVLSSDLSRYREAHKAFTRTLTQKGFDQSNIEIIIQTPNPDPISWANTIRKFNAIRADIIITYGAPVTLSAMREADNIPIVFVDVYGPVETGITRSMSVPGGKLTGVSSKVPMITLIKAAQELKPIRTLGVLYNSREIGSAVQLNEIKRIAAQLGFAVVESNVSSMTALDNALSSLLWSHVDCIYVSESASASRSFEKIVYWANENKLPVISHMPDAAEKGALVALEVNSAEQGEIAGDYAAKILSGKKPAQMSIGTPKKINLVINLKAAKILGLHVPLQVLNLATKLVK